MDNENKVVMAFIIAVVLIFMMLFTSMNDQATQHRNKINEALIAGVDPFAVSCVYNRR